MWSSNWVELYRNCWNCARDCKRVEWVSVCVLWENNSARWNNAEKRAHITVQINHNVMTMAHIALCQCSMHIVGIRHHEQWIHKRERDECAVLAQSHNKVVKTIQHRHITPIFQLCWFFFCNFFFSPFCLFLSSVSLEQFEVLLLFLINIFF